MIKITFSEKSKITVQNPIAENPEMIETLRVYDPQQIPLKMNLQ